MRVCPSEDDPESEHCQHGKDEDQCVEAGSWVDEIEDNFRQPLVCDPRSAGNSERVKIDSRNTEVPDDVLTGF